MSNILNFFDARYSCLTLLRDIVQCYDNTFIVVSNQCELSDVDMILNGLKFSVVKSSFSLNDLGFLFALFDVHRVVYNIDETGVQRLSFRFENHTEFKWLNDVVNVYDFVSGFRNNIKSLTKFNDFYEIYSTVKLNLNSLENISVLDCRMMFSGSFISTNDIFLRKDDTHFDNVMLKEFDAGKVEYETMLTSNISISQNYKNKKLDLFLRAAAFKSVSSSNLVKVQNYPIVYKFYSSYLFQCAVLKMSLGLLSSAFMYYFRALESYCDGLLIYSGIAEVRDFYAKGILKRNDAFLVNGKFVSGFGGKWEEVKKLPEVTATPSNITNYLSDLIQLRNNFIMTHGDVKVNQALLVDIEFNIKLFIENVEMEINQTQTMWSDLFNFFKSFCNVKASSELENFFVDRNLIKFINR